MFHKPFRAAASWNNRVAGLGVLAALFTSAVVAAEPQPPLSASTSKWSWLGHILSGRAAQPAAVPAAPGKDPTRMAPELRKLLQKDEAAKAAPAGMPAPVHYAVPKIALKALVVGGESPSAVLAIGDKQSLFVRAGREYPISGDGAAAVSLVVHRIEADQVDLEIKPAGQKLVLH
jgi:hypothetical protein